MSIYLTVLSFDCFSTCFIQSYSSFVFSVSFGGSHSPGLGYMNEIMSLSFYVSGNVVVLVVVHLRMRSMSKFFMGNLAFANLCVGIFCVFQNLSTFLSEK